MSMQDDAKILEAQVKMKNPLISLVLSLLIIGLGQLYNGQIGKALLLFFGAIISFWLGFVHPLFWIVYAGIVIFNLIDAYTSAQKINEKILANLKNQSENSK